MRFIDQQEVRSGATALFSVPEGAGRACATSLGFSCARGFVVVG